MKKENPFVTGAYNGHLVGHIDVDSRIHTVREFNLDQCKRALNVPGLQRTVERAIKSRIRKLEKESNE
ncbi:MAG: hypothetical protein FVQ79_00510 [Planctomycetes bacterium]|nr:hypothetical protein [Planctomycetota bacterium]